MGNPEKKNTTIPNQSFLLDQIQQKLVGMKHVFYVLNTNPCFACCFTCFMPKNFTKTTKTWLRRQRPGPSGDTAFAKISKCLGSAQSTRGNGLSMAISPCPRTREAQKMRQCESWEKYINSSSWCSSMDKRGWGRNSVKVKVGKTLVNLYVYIYIYMLSLYSFAAKVGTMFLIHRVDPRLEILKPCFWRNLDTLW